MLAKRIELLSQDLHFNGSVSEKSLSMRRQATSHVAAAMIATGNPVEMIAGTFILTITRASVKEFNFSEELIIFLVERTNLLLRSLNSKELTYDLQLFVGFLQYLTASTAFEVLDSEEGQFRVRSEILLNDMRALRAH